MNDVQASLTYYAQQACSPQWRGFVAELVGEFYSQVEEDIARNFFARIGTRLAQSRPLPVCNSLDELEGALGAVLAEMQWGWVRVREAGHHIQNLLGILPRVTRLQQQAGSKAEANALQVKVELQADCLSGVWVNREEKKRPGFLEAGDIDAALTTAAAIGDDTLQRQATGRVVPDSFTHGSAAQRKRWFMTGYQQGTVQACNTFATDNL